MTAAHDRHSGGKRGEILAAAIDRFGRDGYEHTKWADIAADVGLGPSALYYYFESKQHCLFEIMDETLRDQQARFELLTAGNADPIGALLAVLDDCFGLGERDMLRNRLLVAEHGLLAQRRDSPREDQARRRARRRTRELELAWARFLGRAMEAGAIAPAPTRLTARAVLGLYKSIWLWYRPGGTLELDRMTEFFSSRMLAMLGVERGAGRRPEVAA